MWCPRETQDPSIIFRQEARPVGGNVRGQPAFQSPPTAGFDVCFWNSFEGWASAHYNTTTNVCARHQHKSRVKRMQAAQMTNITVTGLCHVVVHPHPTHHQHTNTTTPHKTHPPTHTQLHDNHTPTHPHTKTPTHNKTTQRCIRFSWPWAVNFQDGWSFQVSIGNSIGPFCRFGPIGPCSLILFARSCWRRTRA